MDNHNTAVTSCSLQGCAPPLLFVAFFVKFEHLPLHLEARNWRIKETAFFEGEAKDSEQVHIGAINCAPPFTLQREDFNTCRNAIDRHMVRRLEKTVSVDPLSSRGINKLHLEGDFHLESDFRSYQSIPMFPTKFCKLSHQSHMNPTWATSVTCKTVRQPSNPCFQTLVLVWRTIRTNCRKTRSLIM